MLLARIFITNPNPVWKNLTSFSTILFFIFLADALLSFWIPNFLQDALGSPFLMGLVMSFSSLVGLLADLIFPDLLKGYNVRRLILFSIYTSLAFVGSLFVAVKLPFILVFLLCMALWGIYYEYLHFSQAQFVADTLPRELKSTGWAIIGTFKNLAYFLGPLVAGVLLLKGEYVFLAFVLILVIAALHIFYLTKAKGGHGSIVNHERVSILSELSHWKVLFTKVWPVVVLSLFIGVIDATFWTTGAVWTEKLSTESWLGSFLLPLYQLPYLFVWLVLGKWKIYKGKKRLSEKFLLMAGVFLSLLYFDFPIPIYVFLVFVSSIYLAISVPLVEAVYSDITSRMGIERKHLIGLSASTISLAYIISPSLSGYIASQVGEKYTFVVVGLFTAFIALILLFVTPKKIRLPAHEIQKWRVSK